ncbi:MAG: aminopeptidase P N-terminal domain-containing protein [Armatimonadota bacterium]
MVTVLAAMMFAQEGFPFRVYEADKIAASEFAARRAEYIKSIPSGSFALLVTNPLHQRSNDTDFPFRPNSYFWYLSGCEEQDSALVLAPDGIRVNGKVAKEILFVADKNPQSETWTGVLMGPEKAKELLGVEMVLSNKSFASVLGSLTQAKGALIEKPEGLSGRVASFVKSFEEWQAQHAEEKGLRKPLDVMRSIKSPAEVALTYKSMNATCNAHKEALMSCEPGMREWEIASLVEYIFARNGCEAVAYGSIVGSGMNSCILHYPSPRKRIENGDFICMDVGAEYHGYASDVTRSYPANGKFSAEQRAIYEIVLRAQEAGVRAANVGAPFTVADTVARQIVADGLIKLGIIKDAKEVRRYFMHGTSHYVGLDVHDTGDYGPLKANQIITVEPGIYIKEGSACDKKWWNIGVRIEDTVLISDNGPINMSGNQLPRSIPEIEALMAKKGLGNRPEGKIALNGNPSKLFDLAHTH